MSTIRRVWGAMTVIAVLLTILPGVDWLLMKLGLPPLPKIDLAKLWWLPWLGVVMLLTSGAFWLGLYKRYKPVQPPPITPKVPPGATRVETVVDTTKPGITRTSTSVEYLDGLPTTPNPSRRSLFEKARELEAKSEFKQAIPLFQKLLEQPASPSEETALLILIGNCFLNLSQLDEAQKHYTEALAKAQRLKNEEAEANALGNLGLVYADKGDLDGALEYHQKALAIDQKIANPLGQANALCNLGIVYFQKGDLDKALENYNKVLDIHKKIPNPLSEANALGNMGLVYQDKGDLDKALEHYQKALAIFEKIGAKLEIERAKKNIATIEKLKADKK